MTLPATLNRIMELWILKRYSNNRKMLNTQADICRFLIPPLKSFFFFFLFKWKDAVIYFFSGIVFKGPPAAVSHLIQSAGLWKLCFQQTDVWLSPLVTILIKTEFWHITADSVGDEQMFLMAKIQALRKWRKLSQILVWGVQGGPRVSLEGYVSTRSTAGTQIDRNWPNADVENEIKTKENFCKRWKNFLS